MVTEGGNPDVLTVCREARRDMEEFYWQNQVGSMTKFTLRSSLRSSALVKEQKFASQAHHTFDFSFRA